MMETRWRLYARPIIAQVLAETRGQPEAVIRRALRDAYPFGERKYYPYKVWLDEIKKQRSPTQPIVRQGDPCKHTLNMFEEPLR